MKVSIELTGNKLVKFLLPFFFAVALIGLLGAFSNLMAQDLPKPADKVLKDTTINSVSHKLYVGSRGGKYILMTSKKTGKQYKKYFTTKKAI